MRCRLGAPRLTVALRSRSLECVDAQTDPTRERLRALVLRRKAANSFRPDTLARLRREAGLSLRELAEVLGVNQSTVMRWERGDAPPSDEHVDRLLAVVRDLADAVAEVA